MQLLWPLNAENVHKSIICFKDYSQRRMAWFNSCLEFECFMNKTQISTVLV